MGEKLLELVLQLTEQLPDEKLAEVEKYFRGLLKKQIEEEDLKPETDSVSC
ncbi:hypothetical protein ES703_86176 [subsurface metagenome]